MADRSARAEGDRLRSSSMNTLNLEAGPNEISGLFPRDDEWLTTTARLPPPWVLWPLRPMGAQVRSMAARGFQGGYQGCDGAGGLRSEARISAFASGIIWLFLGN